LIRLRRKSAARLIGRGSLDPQYGSSSVQTLT
jgi:hypothetical protein